MEVQNVGDRGTGKYGASWDGGLASHPLGAPKETESSTLTPCFKTRIQSKPVFVAEEINTRGQVVSSSLTDAAGSGDGPS